MGTGPALARARGGPGTDLPRPFAKRRLRAWRKTRGGFPRDRDEVLDSCFAPAWSRRRVHRRGDLRRRWGQVLAPMAWPGRNRRLPRGETAARVDRNEERSLEEGDPRPRRRHAGRLGQRPLCLDRGSGGSERGRSARRTRQSSRHPQIRRHGPRPQGRPGRLGARRPRGHAARASHRSGAPGPRPRSSPTAHM